MIKPQLLEGRPKDETGRLARELRVYDFLDHLNISYWRADHEQVSTMQDLPEVDKALGVVMCKNLFLCNRQKTDFYLLCMPADKPFKTKELSGQLGISRLSFAEPEYLLSFLDIEPGAVSIMGLMNDREMRVRLLMDEDLKEVAYFGCHPCVSTTSMRFKMSDIQEIYLPVTEHEPTWVKLTGEQAKTQGTYDG